MFEVSVEQRRKNGERRIVKGALRDKIAVGASMNIVREDATTFKSTPVRTFMLDVNSDSGRVYVRTKNNVYVVSTIH